MSDASNDNQEFLEVSGVDLVDGDGALNYGPEKAIETYYDSKISNTTNGSPDYQFVNNLAFKG